MTYPSVFFHSQKLLTRYQTIKFFFDHLETHQFIRRELEMLSVGRFRILTCLLFASGLTATTSYLNMRCQSTARLDQAMMLARQIADEVESLSLFAQERQEPNPLGWAIHFLNVGDEMRPVHIATVDMGDPALNPEQLRSYFRNNTFTYYNHIHEEKKEIVKIDISIGYIGFLGSTTPFMNDVTLVLFFLVSFLTIHLLLKTQSKSTVSHEWVISKIDESKVGLMHLGIKVKTMTQLSRDLIVTFPELHLKLDQIRKTLAQTLAGDPTDENRSFALEDCIGQVKLDVETALERQSKLPEHTKQLNSSITETTQQILMLARLIQQFKDDVKLNHST